MYGLFHDECACESWCDNEEGFQAAANDDRFFQVEKERELEKLAEEKNKKRRSKRAFKQSLMMLDEKTTREARAGPLLSLHGR
ncbi:hypothetical protein ACEQPO_28260 [Bacillus sp. SL00103]